MRWLVTGGCGFIGKRLVHALLNEGESVRVLDNLSVGTRGDLQSAGEVTDISDGSGSWPEPRSGAQLRVGDIRDSRAACDSAQGADVIVHLAANTGVEPSVRDPRTDCETNVIGTLNILEAARAHGIPRFVFASSGAPVGECDPPIHEEIAPHPVSPYGASKLAGEGYCSAYFRTFGIETVALRFGNVYGPGSNHKSSVVAKFIRQALAGETLEIYGDGNQTRDFIYVDDLIDAIVKAARVEGIGGEIFQIATSRETSVNELVKKLESILCKYGQPQPKIKSSDSRRGDVKRNYSDTTKARQSLNWMPRHELREGLDLVVRSFCMS